MTLCFGRHIQLTTNKDSSATCDREVAVEWENMSDTKRAKQIVSDKNYLLCFVVKVKYISFYL